MGISVYADVGKRRQIGKIFYGWINREFSFPKRYNTVKNSGNIDLAILSTKPVMPHVHALASAVSALYEHCSVIVIANPMLPRVCPVQTAVDVLWEHHSQRSVTISVMPLSCPTQNILSCPTQNIELSTELIFTIKIFSALSLFIK